MRSIIDDSRRLVSAGIATALFPIVKEHGDYYIFWVARHGDVHYLYAQRPSTGTVASRRLQAPPAHSGGGANPNVFLSPRQWSLVTELARSVEVGWLP